MLLDTIPIENPTEPETYKSPLDERYTVVLLAAQQAVGKRLGAGRDKEDVLIRMFTAYRLREEGYSLEAIGKALGRNHSTVIHYVQKRLPDMLSIPHIYRSEAEMFNKMNEILGEV